MKSSELKRALKMVIGTGKRQSLTPFIVGKPGIGKSHIVAQVADELGMDLIDIRLSQHDSTDLKGIPHVDEESRRSYWAAPDFLPFANNPKFKNTTGILFLDEINRAAPDVIQSCFELIYDMRIGENYIADGWYIIAAGNLGAEDGCDVNEFDAAMNGRLVKLYLDENIGEWVEWATIHSIRPEIIGFIKSNSKYFYYEVDKSRNEWVTPRHWAKFSKLIDDNNDIHSIKEITSLLGNSIVHGAAAMFMQYLTEIESVNGEDILKKYDEISHITKSYELSRLTQLNDNLAEVLKKREASTAKTKIKANELENLRKFLEENLQDDLLLGLWKNVGKDAPSIAMEFGKKFTDFDSKISGIILKSLNMQSK